MKKISTLFFLSVFFNYVNAQTALISASDGGFENATVTFAANGWTAVNGGNNFWYVGTAAIGAGTHGVYIDKNATGGTTNTYNQGTAQTNHFYRDIAIPAGASNITLSFLLQGSGQVGLDRLLVYTAPNTVTPVSGTPASNSTVLAGATLVYTQTAFIATFTTQTVTLPNTLAGTTVRLIFTWQNDGSAGTNPSAALDNISLTYIGPPTISAIAPNPVCTGAPETITGTNFSTATAVTVNGVSVGAFTIASATSITFTVPAGATSGVVSVINPNSSATSAASLTVNPTPAAPTINSTPVSPVCQNTGGQTYTVTNAGLTYAWTVAGTGWSPITGSGTSFTTASGTTSGTIAVTGSTAFCTSAPSSVITTLIPVPAQPSAISPATAVCAFSTQTYSVTNVAGVSYNWVFPAGWTINSANGSNTINVTVGAAGGTITVTPSNSCGNSGPAQTLSATVNTSTLTISTPIPATGYIPSGTTSVTVFGFTLTPNACVTSYNFTAVSIQTGGTALNTDLGNFQIVYDANANGIYDAGDAIVSAAAQALPGPLNFTIAGQTGISGTRNYLVITDISSSAVSGNTFSGNLIASGVNAAGATVSGNAGGNLQTIEGSVTITAIQPAAGSLLQNTTNNPIAEYQLTATGGTFTPSSFKFTTAGTYVSGTDITNFKLWQSPSNIFNTATATQLQTIAAAGNPQTITFNTGFTALSSVTSYYFFITSDIPTAGINGDNVNIATDALTNFVFTTTVVRSGTNPATVGNPQTIAGSMVTVTQAHPAAGNISQNTTANPIAAYQIAVSNFAATPTNFIFTTGGTYISGTDITNLELYANSSNSLTGAILIQTVSAPVTGGTATFSAGFTSLPVGNYYFIVAADAGSCVSNGKTVSIAAGTANFANFSFTSGGNYVTKTGPVNPVPASNTQTIVSPSVAIVSAHPVAGSLSQNSTNNIVASYQMTAVNGSVVPTSFTFTTGGTYTAGNDFTNFQLWVNDNNNLGAATLIGSIAVTPTSGGSITFSSFPAAATIAAGTSSYFLITADVPLSGVNGDYVNIAADALANIAFTSSSGGCVSTSGSLTVSNNQTISGPVVAISTSHPAAANIVEGSTNNMIAIYQLNVSNAVSVTPASITLTTSGAYSAADFTNFKVYENTNATLSGAILVQTVAAIPALGGNVTFNSGFTPVGSSVTTYIIITADVASTATLGDVIDFTTTAFTNFSFISYTGSGVQETGTNPSKASKAQTIVGPQVNIATQHNLAGNILRGSQNNLLAIYSVTATNASITPSSVMFVTGGSYTGTNDIQDFNLYQNNAPTLTGATLVGTVLTTGAASGQSVVFNSGFTSITSVSPNNINYLILVADVAGSATPGDYISINSIAAPLSANFSFTSSGPVVITTAATLAASNNQTIVNKLDVYWSGAGNWDNVTNNWAQVTGGPYTTSVWLENGYGFFEGIAGKVSIVSPVASIIADSLTSNVNNYQIDASASGNGITLVSPASFTVNTGTTYVGINNPTFAVLGGTNGMVKRGTGELQIAAPFQSNFAGTVFVNAGELTLGAKNGTSDPYLFFPGNNSLYLNNAKLTLAGSSTIGGGGFGRYSFGSPRNLSIFKSYGANTINLYQTSASATAWMRVWPSTDGNLPTAATSTPFEINGTLTLTPAGIVTGTVGSNWNQQNAIVTGSTTFTGNTTLIGYASNGASISSGAGTHVNFNIGGAGHYLYGVKGSYSNGTIADNGYSLTFLGGGNSGTDGSELCLNSTSSVMTGNWTIGDAAGINAGWLVANTTTSLTTGAATINNYSKLTLQITSGKSKNITYAPSSISIYGLGPANQTYYPSALDLYNITSDSINTISLASNVVLNPAGAGTLASIGVEVGGYFTNVVSFQLNGTVSGTAGLEKVGPGNLILNAQNASGYVNSYQGNTQINAGYLTVNYSSNLGTAGLLLAQSADALTGSDSNTKAGFNTQLILNNISQTVSSIATSWVNNDGETQIITLNGNTLTDNQSTNTTFGNSTTGSSLGYISGTGNFIKMGTGTLTLTGPNTYSGLTQVKGGTLALSRTGGTTLPVTNTVDILGGMLSVTTAQTLKNVTLSTGTLNIASGITLTITGSFTLVNGTITGGGTLAYSNGTLIYAGSGQQTVNSVNNPVEWPGASIPTNVTFDNFTYTGLTSGGVKLIAGKTVAGTATVNGWLDFAGNSITGTGAFTLNGLTSKSYTGNVTSGSNFITNLSAINGIYPGMMVTGNGIPTGTYILYIDTVVKSQTLYLNNNVTVTGTAVALSITTRGGVKVSLPAGLDNGTTRSHVQVTGTKTYNSGADYVFNSPTSGTHIYPAFPTTPATLTYSPAWDIKMNVGSGNYIAMTPSGVGSSIEIADTLMLSTGIWATNTGLITWDNPGSSYLSVPQPTWTANNTAYTNSFIATCDTTGTPINVAGPTTPFNAGAGFKIKSVTNADTYFPIGASFSAAFAGQLPAPDRMMINNQYINGGVLTPEDFTVVVNYGDILYTPGGSGAYRVNRIWYVKTSGAPTDSGSTTMKLFFTKRDNSAANWLWPAAGGENEVESGFDYSQPALVEKDYSGIATNYIRLSTASTSDIPNFLNAAVYPFNTEIYGVYTIGVSSALNGTKNGIGTFNRFSVVNSGGIVLPVKIINFKAYQQGSGVQTSWTCLNEINMDHYEMERSADAINFSTLGSVNALDNNQPSVNYGFLDRNPLQGSNYYRIKAIGKDGSLTYTNIEVVVIGGSASAINIYPNPVTNHTFVLQMTNLNAGNYTLEIYNTPGQLILHQMINHAGGSASQTIVLPAGTARGEYHVKLLGATIEMNKMINVQ